MTTPANEVITPHFAWPFQLGRGQAFSVVEQDSPEDVGQCVTVLLSTLIGSREELPEYGIDDPTFTTQIDTTTLLEVISEWEDRADIELSDGINTLDQLRHDIAVSVGLAG